MRGHGHIPDDISHTDTIYSAGFADSPSSAFLSQWSIAYLDQWQTESCVGFACAGAIWTALGAMGKTQVLPSPLAIYHDARRLKNGRGSELVDNGCSPRYAWESLRDGIILWDDWPFVASAVNQDPDWCARKTAIDRSWLNWSRIEFRTGVQRRVSTGNPVCMGITVDDGFESWKGPEPWRLTGTIRGRHYVYIVGYDEGGVMIANSWGPDWGHGGYGWVAWDEVESIRTTDIVTPEIDVRRMP